MFVQYGYFMRDLVQGDMGDSIRKKQPVTTVIADRIGATLFLVFYALILSIILTVPMATVAALNKERWPDQIVRIFTLGALAMPAYWVGMMLLQLLSVKYKIFPVAGYGDGFTGHLYYLFLPAFSLALAIAALTIRSLRSSILETLGSDYVRTARAKGLSSRSVFTWHVMRNSSLSSITLLGLVFVFLIGGTTIMETIFSIPGHRAAHRARHLRPGLPGHPGGDAGDRRDRADHQSCDGHHLCRARSAGEARMSSSAIATGEMGAIPAPAGAGAPLDFRGAG